MVRGVRAALAAFALAALVGPAAAAETCGAGPAFSSTPALRSMAVHVAAQEPTRILAIGSSSTEGIGASSPALSYPSRLEAKLRAAFPDEEIGVANAGVGGETADETLTRLEQALAGPAKPDLVLWQVGTNDAVKGTDEAAFAAMVRRGIALVHQAGADLVLLDQQYYPKIADPARYERYVRALSDLGAKARVAVFSRYAMMRAWNEQDPALLTGMLSGDGFHMSDRGYECLAAALASNLTNALERSGADLAVARGRKLPPPAVAGLRKG